MLTSHSTRGGTRGAGIVDDAAQRAIPPGSAPRRGRTRRGLPRTDETLGRDVAIKVFRENAVAEDEFRKQEAEVSLLASLNHPSVVTLLDAAIDRSAGDTTRIYYVMELVEGTDLRKRLESGPLPPRQVAQVGQDIAEALEYLHLQGLVHRDIKPANMLLGDYIADGARVRAKLTDLGIATLGGSEPLAEHEMVTGTVAYLSPEQASGRAVDAATDIYSLGLVLIECLTGRLAFPGPPEHSALARLLDDPELPEHAGEKWRSLLAAMTARDPADRPSAKDVVLALRDRLASESGKHALAPDEAARLDAASRFELAAQDGEANFERITAMAAAALGAPIALLSVVSRIGCCSRPRTAWMARRPTPRCCVTRRPPHPSASDSTRA